MNAKSIIILSVIGLALAGGGYATGRYAAPTKVLVTEKVVTVEKQVVVTQVKTEIKIVKVADVAKDVHKETTTEKRADGTVVVTEKVDDKSKTHTASDTEAKKDEVHIEEKLVYKDREVTKLVERDRPQWSLALQPGFEFGTALGLGGESSNLLKNLPVKHIMANVVVERRLLGPVLVGAWVNTRLDAGLSIRLEW